MFGQSHLNIIRQDFEFALAVTPERFLNLSVLPEASVKAWTHGHAGSVWKHTPVMTSWVYHWSEPFISNI